VDFLLDLSVPVAIVLWVRWYSSLRLSPALRVTRPGRVAFVVIPVLCMIFLFAVLKRFSADSVKSDSSTVILFLLLGASWVGLAQLVFGLLGISARDDVIERGNAAAVWVVSGQIVGSTLCFAGANVGNGPGPEVVAFCALLSTSALFLVWFLVECIGSVADTITIDRHLGTGIRMCGWLIATGIVLGDAVTGNWKSVSATVRDFAVCGWPAAATALAVALLERKLCRLGPNHAWNGLRRSAVLAAVCIVVASGYAWKRGIH
jgi:hypothetical protein